MQVNWNAKNGTTIKLTKREGDVMKQCVALLGQIARNSDADNAAQIEQAQTAIERVIETHAPTEATE